MFVKKNLGFRAAITFTGGHIIWLTAWAVLVTWLYEYFDWAWMKIPWLPLSVIGVAVAFYIGFKNNQSYDRLWEARKIWGAIVNSSRAWGSTVKAYVTNQFTENKYSEEELYAIKRRLIYRHMAWLYAHRSQLLLSAPWEYINQGVHIARAARQRMKRFGIGLLDDGISE